MQPRSIGTFLLVLFGWPPVSLRLFLFLVLHAQPHDHSLADQRVCMHTVLLAAAWNKQCFPSVIASRGNAEVRLVSLPRRNSNRPRSEGCRRGGRPEVCLG